MDTSKCIFCESKIKAPTQENERWCFSCNAIRKSLVGIASLIKTAPVYSKKSREFWAKELISLDIET